MIKKLKYLLLAGALFSPLSFGAEAAQTTGFKKLEPIIKQVVEKIAQNRGLQLVSTQKAATINSIFDVIGKRVSLGLGVGGLAYLASDFIPREGILALVNGDHMYWASNGLLTYVENTPGSTDIEGTENLCTTVAGNTYCTTNLGTNQFIEAALKSHSLEDFGIVPNCQEGSGCEEILEVNPVYCTSNGCYTGFEIGYAQTPYGQVRTRGHPITLSRGPIPTGLECPNTKNGQCFRYPSETSKSEYSDLDLSNLKLLIPPLLLDQPIPFERVAEEIDRAWREAASKPNYPGIPYSYDYPVTPEILDPIPERLKVGDLLTPATVTQGANSTEPTVSPSPQTDGVIQPERDPNSQNLDLGPDPSVGEPTGITPTIESILAPFFDLLPDFKNANFQDGHGVCEPLEFNALGLFKTTTVHCDLFEQIKPMIYLIMSLVWLFVAIRIVLEA